MDKVLKSDKRVDLFEYMVNENEPYGEQGYWYAGQQLEALSYYLSPKIKILAEYQEDDYRGKCFAIMKVEDNIVIWRDYFGSCSGCDGLEEQNGFKYIKETLTEGNTLQFKSLEDAEQYVKEDQKECIWPEWNMPDCMFETAKKVIK